MGNVRARCQCGALLSPLVLSRFYLPVDCRYIPSNLAYGDNGRVAGCLVFTMEILKINGGTKPKAA